jgi:hypothetical protein
MLVLLSSFIPLLVLPLMAFWLKPRFAFPAG